MFGSHDSPITLLASGWMLTSHSIVRSEANKIEDYR